MYIRSLLDSTLDNVQFNRYITDKHGQKTSITKMMHGSKHRSTIKSQVGQIQQKIRASTAFTKSKKVEAHKITLHCNTNLLNDFNQINYSSSYPLRRKYSRSLNYNTVQEDKGSKNMIKNQTKFFNKQKKFCQSKSFSYLLNSNSNYNKNNKKLNKIKKNLNNSLQTKIKFIPNYKNINNNTNYTQNYNNINTLQSYKVGPIIIYDRPMITKKFYKLNYQKKMILKQSKKIKKEAQIKPWQPEQRDEQVSKFL